MPSATNSDSKDKTSDAGNDGAEREKVKHGRGYFE